MMILSGLKTLVETGETLDTPGSLRYSARRSRPAEPGQPEASPQPGGASGACVRRLRQEGDHLVGAAAGCWSKTKWPAPSSATSFASGISRSKRRAPPSRANSSSAPRAAASARRAPRACPDRARAWRSPSSGRSRASPAARGRARTDASRPRCHPRRRRRRPSSAGGSRTLAVDGGHDRLTVLAADRLGGSVPATVAEEAGVADHQRRDLVRVIARPREPDEPAPVVDDEHPRPSPSPRCRSVNASTLRSNVAGRSSAESPSP